MEPKEYPYVFLNAPTGGYLGLLVGSISFIVAVWASTQSPLNIVVVVGAGLVGITLWLMSVRSLANTNAALKLGPIGLWTPKLGFLPWKHIQVVLDSVSSGKAGSFEILIIKNRQSQKQLEVIALSGLSGPKEKISQLLQQYKRS